MFCDAIESIHSPRISAARRQGRAASESSRRSAGPGIGHEGLYGWTDPNVEVVQDEEGKTLLRNISVNGVAVDKFPQG